MPFEATISSFGNHSVVRLKNLATAGYAEVFTFGALLNRFAAPVNNDLLNVVDGFTDIHDAIENIAPFFKSAKLSPYACRVKNARYKFGETEYSLTKYSSRGNALHGLLYDAAFSIVEHGGNNDSAFVKLAYSYSNENEGFPFTYNCEVEYKLTEANKLTITTTITNSGDKLMPIVDGWHPYFTLGDKIDDYQLEFQSKEMLEFDEELIPTGKLISFQEFGSLKQFGPTVYDNCFTLNFAECQPMCVVRNPLRKVQLEIHPSAAYPYLQIYTPEHRKSIAIENLSAAPDAFNNALGLKILQPGESTAFATTFIIRSL